MAYSEIIGLWFDTDAPAASHISVLRGAPIWLLCFICLCGLNVAVKRSFYSCLCFYVVYTAFIAHGVAVATNGNKKVSGSLQPQIQLSLLLLLLPKQLYLAAAICGCLTDVLLFRGIGFGYVLLKCCRSSKIRKMFQ